MAQIDFSNAHIENINPNAFVTNINSNNNWCCLVGSLWHMNLSNNTKTQLIVAGVNSGTNSNGTQIVNISNSGCSIIRSGTCKESGNCIAIVDNVGTSATANIVWIISNIEFQTGDTFSFQINFNVSYQ